MKTGSPFKVYHYIISAIVSLISFLFALGYGWTTYGTIVNRGGMNYSGYNYYNASKEFWVLYLIIISLATLATPLILLKMFIKKITLKTHCYGLDWLFNNFFNRENLLNAFLRGKRIDTNKIEKKFL